MSIVSARNFNVHKSYDKENIQPNRSNINGPKLSVKQPIKTGVEIKNKLKGQNVYKLSSMYGKKQQMRKNSHILQKFHRKMFQSKNRNNDKNQTKDQCNLSSSSSTRSIKSVTFSINYGIDEESSLSRSSSSTGLRTKSILKNKLNKDKQLSNCQKNSLASSYCSHLKSVDQAVENPNSNNIILNKYERLLKELKANNQKYTDTIYPPCEQSIFLKNSYTKDFLQKLNAQGYRIKWVRITQLFPAKELCLWHPSTKSIITQGFIHSSGKQNNFLPTVLNAINQSYLMQKFFENQKLSQQGIYFVKMHQTQTNNWKYVIIDDFIPVIVSTKKHEMGKIIKPAFLNVESENKILQLWPFLLQKAFAKYYSTYDTLIKGNTLDFLEEVTGEYYTTLSLNFLQEETQTGNRQKIDKIMKNPYNIILAETMDGLIYPLRSVSPQIQLLDIQNNYKLQIIEKNNFQNYFTKLHIIQAKKYLKQINCPIKQEHLLEKQKELSENKKPFILRSFNLHQSNSIVLALTQKEERFHRNNKTSKIKQNYEYSWMRVILVLKESTGYRWIKAAYERKKTVKLQAHLEPGEYFVVILPEWSIKPYDIKLSLFSNCETVIERKAYECHMRIIEQSCMDLAQRYGKLTQINGNICSYNYIDYTNINNEKSSGQVKILRTIDGLEMYNITPVNIEFEQSQKLEIKIASLQSYTVVLKVLGGVDKSFLEQFDFGI